VYAPLLLPLIYTICINKTYPVQNLDTLGTLKNQVYYNVVKPSPLTGEGQGEGGFFDAQCIIWLCGGLKLCRRHNLDPILEILQKPGGMCNLHIFPTRHWKNSQIQVPLVLHNLCKFPSGHTTVLYSPLGFIKVLYFPPRP